MKAFMGVVIIVFFLSALAWCQENSIKLTLNESVEQAIKGNLDVKIAETQFQRMESEVTKNEASFKLKANLEAVPANWIGKINNFNYRPEANLSANLLTKNGTTYSFNVEEGEGDGGLKTTLLSLTLTKKILPHPKLNSFYFSLKKSLLNLRRNELSLEEQKNHLKFEVKTSFYNILKQEREIELEKLYLEQAKENLTVVKDKLRKGLSNKLDLLNAQLEVAGAEKSLFQNQNRLKRYLTEFKNLLGIGSWTKVELIEESEYDYEPFEIKLNQAIEEALRNRVEIKQQKLTIQACKLDLALTKSKSSPSLNFSGGYNYSYGGEFPLKEREEYKASLTFEIPLLDGGEGRAEIREAKENLRESELNLEKLKRNIITEIQDYFLDLQEKEKQIEFLKLSKEKYQIDLSIAKEMFYSGSITKDELREKEIAFKQAQIDLLNALLDHEIAKSRLLKSIGEEL